MLQQALESKDYQNAINLIKEGAKLPEDIQSYRKTQIYTNLIRDKQFSILKLFAQQNSIETDLYEYDSFKGSFFEVFFKHADSDTETLEFFTEFMGLISSINEELENQSLLSLAIHLEAPEELLTILVQSGCDVHIRNRAEENLIHQTVKKYTRNSALFLTYLQFLVDEGVDINATNIIGETPLFLAIKEHRNDYLPFLLENGADAMIPNKNGDTIFHLAIAQQLDEEKYRLLRNYQLPDFSLANAQGETILFEFIRRNYSVTPSYINLLTLLLEDGASIYEKSLWYQKEKTALDALAEKPSALLETVLQTIAVDVNLQDEEGNTLLHKVCAYDSNHEDKKAKETYRKVKLLLQKGADKNITNRKEQTPLMLASEDNLKTKTVELLLTFKA